MKKILCAVLSIILVMTPFAAFVPGRQFALLTQNGYAKVLEIIDGDSLLVEFVPTKETALIRLIGVDAGGYDDAAPYLMNAVLGKDVLLYFDDNIPMATANRWNNMYAYLNGVLINRELIYLGYAKLNAGHEKAALYTALKSGETNARDAEAGVWSVPADPFAPFGRFIKGETNINTANRTMLRELLNAAMSDGRWAEGRWEDAENKNTDGKWVPGYWDTGHDTSFNQYMGLREHDALIENILYYRARNPFDTIYELKFVKGMTKEIFDKIKTKITVSTNLTAATGRELMTLGDINPAQVNRILRERENTPFLTTEKFLDSAFLTDAVYAQIRLFVDFVGLSEIDVRVPDITANVNTGDMEELMGIGLAEIDAERIIAGRAERFTYKTIGEIGRVTGFNDDTLNAYEDNFVLNAARGYAFDGININTATAAQLRGLDLSDEAYGLLRLKQGRMLTYHHLPDVEELYLYDQEITLYTNVNAAGRRELESLFTSAGQTVINEIMDYRNDQLFGSLDEVRQFFEDKGLSNVYNGVREFITVR